MKKDNLLLSDEPEVYFTVLDSDSMDESLKEEIAELLKLRTEILNSHSDKFGINNQLNAHKVTDGIIGFAIGDALGVPVEFLSREELNKHPISEMKGYGSHMVPEGTWSDDTSLMLATMDSIVEKNGLDYYDMMHKFLEWYDNAKYTATNLRFDVGGSTSTAITRFKEGVSLSKCGCSDIIENGNGSLMRILPIVYYLASKNLSEEEEVAVINDASSLTHAHEISCLGCKIYSDYIKQLLNGSNKIEALEFIKKKNYIDYYSSDSVERYRRILNGDLSTCSCDEIKSYGYVVSTLEASLWATLTSDSYEEAVCKAVNLGKDTDTIGAITGAINGIIYGKSQIPSRWIRDLKNKEYLYSLSDKFTETLKSISLETQNVGENEVNDMLQEPIITSQTSDYNNQHK